MKKRYIIGLALLGMIAVMFSPYSPILPVIQLPGEPIFGDHLPVIGEITNTFIATVITYAILFGLGLVIRSKIVTADEVPTGGYNLFEMLIERAYGFVENAAGKHARSFFPFFMTFILVILTANWLELVPGVDSIGKLEDIRHVREHQAEAYQGIDDEEALHDIYEAAGNTGNWVRNGIFVVPADRDADGNPIGEEANATIAPFVRVPATDLNFTLAMAIISVVMTQYYGFKVLGGKYLKKFFTFDADKIAKNPLGLMDTLVGIIEFVSEIAKILSFAFRLLGNIFAGQVLLFVIGFLAPVALIAVYGLEFFVGAIQAMVFGMLTLTFFSGATVSHDHDDEHH